MYNYCLDPVLQVRMLVAIWVGARITWEVSGPTGIQTDPGIQVQVLVFISFISLLIFGRSGPSLQCKGFPVHWFLLLQA